MFFITFEGIEGSGKTTICKKLLTSLLELNYKVKLIREPGGNDLSEPIRQLIINNETKFTPLSEVFLFFASQLQNNYMHWNKEWEIIISDRYFDSTIVYDGYVKNEGMEKIDLLRKQINLKIPDLTVWIDIDPKVAMQRIKKRVNEESNRFDKYPLSFHQKVREGYQKLQLKYSERIIKIENNGELRNTFDQVLKLIKSRIETKA